MEKCKSSLSSRTIGCFCGGDAVVSRLKRKKEGGGGGRGGGVQSACGPTQGTRPNKKCQNEPVIWMLNKNQVTCSYHGLTCPCSRWHILAADTHVHMHRLGRCSRLVIVMPCSVIVGECYNVTQRFVNTQGRTSSTDAG